MFRGCVEQLPRRSEIRLADESGPDGLRRPDGLPSLHEHIRPELPMRNTGMRVVICSCSVSPRRCSPGSAAAATAAEAPRACARLHRRRRGPVGCGRHVLRRADRGHVRAGERRDRRHGRRDDDASRVNFDVTYDPTKLTFTPAASYASPLFPSALVGVSLLDDCRGASCVDPAARRIAGRRDSRGPERHAGSYAHAGDGATFSSTSVAFENTESDRGLGDDSTSRARYRCRISDGGDRCVAGSIFRLQDRPQS